MISHLFHGSGNEKADVRIRRLRIETENAESLGRLVKTLGDANNALRVMRPKTHELNEEMKDLVAEAAAFGSSMSATARNMASQFKNKDKFKDLFTQLRQLRTQSDYLKTQLADLFVQEGRDPDKFSKRLEREKNAGRDLTKQLHDVRQGILDVTSAIESKSRTSFLGGGAGIQSALSGWAEARQAHGGAGGAILHGFKGLFTSESREKAAGMLTSIGAPSGLARAITNPGLLIASALAKAAQEGAKVHAEVYKIASNMSLLSGRVSDVKKPMEEMVSTFGMSTHEAAEYVDRLRQAGMRGKELVNVSKELYENQLVLGISLDSQLKLYQMIARDSRLPGRSILEAGQATAQLVRQAAIFGQEMQNFSADKAVDAVTEMASQMRGLSYDAANLPKQMFLLYSAAGLARMGIARAADMSQDMVESIANSALGLQEARTSALMLNAAFAMPGATLQQMLGAINAIHTGRDQAGFNVPGFEGKDMSGGALRLRFLFAPLLTMLDKIDPKKFTREGQSEIAQMAVEQTPLGQLPPNMLSRITEKVQDKLALRRQTGAQALQDIDQKGVLEEAVREVADEEVAGNRMTKEAAEALKRGEVKKVDEAIRDHAKGIEMWTRRTSMLLNLMVGKAAFGADYIYNLFGGKDQAREGLLKGLRGDGDIPTAPPPPPNAADATPTARRAAAQAGTDGSQPGEPSPLPPVPDSPIDATSRAGRARAAQRAAELRRRQEAAAAAQRPPEQGPTAGDTIRFAEGSLGSVGTGLDAYDDFYTVAGHATNVDPAFLKALAYIEDRSGKPDAVGPPTRYGRAKGVMGLMDGTVRRFGVKNSFDPAENIMGGAKYFRYLLDYYHGDVDRAVAAYRAGEGKIPQTGDIPNYSDGITTDRQYKAILYGKWNEIRTGVAAPPVPGVGGRRPAGGSLFASQRVMIDEPDGGAVEHDIKITTRQRTRDNQGEPASPGRRGRT